MDYKMKQPEWTIRGGSPLQLAGMLALAASLVFGFTASAATLDEKTASTTGTDVAESSKDAEGMVQDKINEWLQEGPGRDIRARDELNVVWGTSGVVLKADDRRWTKARSLAYQNAFVQAMGNYIRSVRQDNRVKLMRKYFQQDIPEEELKYREGEAPDSYVERVILKSTALAERTLDQKLAESGMSDEEIRRLANLVQKKTAMAERISIEMLNEAVGSAAGLIPVKTFEEIDDEDNTAIGVVAVYSERMRHIANQISSGGVILADPDRKHRSIMDELATYETGELPNEFGVRLWWDERGYPAIVSFGQWGWSSANLSKKKRARRRKFAMEQAGNDALSNLTVFIKAATRFTKKSTRGADIEEFTKVWRSGEAERGLDEATIADKLVKTAKVKARVKLTGYTQERSWSARHPVAKEQEIVGVVAYWSPAREDAIRRTIGEKAKHAAPKKDTQKDRKKRISGGAQSRDPNMADF